MCIFRKLQLRSVETANKLLSIASFVWFNESSNKGASKQAIPIHNEKSRTTLFKESSNEGASKRIILQCYVIVGGEFKESSNEGASKPVE